MNSYSTAGSRRIEIPSDWIRDGGLDRLINHTYQNAFLSDTEIAELQAELPNLWQHHVEKLSGYMASTGKTYQNHTAAIRRWAVEDRRGGG